MLKPPLSKKLRAGVVVLRPSQSIGRHTTGEHEELIVVLAGSARVRAGAKVVNLKSGTAVFIPGKTWHNVTNYGTSTLRYVYIVG